MSENTRGKIRVLVVEDRPEDAELMIRYLVAAGFEPDWRRVQTAEEFFAGLEFSPEVILADYTVPQFGAMSALKLLQERGLEIPFIVVSGSVGEEAAAATIREGADDYLLKDRLARLGSAVAQVLEKCRLRSERLRMASELRESEGLFRQLASHIEKVLWLANPAGTEILYVSPAYEKIWGHSCASLHAAPESWFESVHPVDRAQVLARRAVPFSESRPDEVYRILRPDDTIRWIREKVFPIRNETGEIYRVAGIAEDITEQRELEEQLRQAQKMEAVGQLAGGVAHDFNNILTVIQGYTQCLMSETGLAKGSQDELSEVLMASERAAGLTRQLLAFSRKQVMQVRPLNLNDVVTGVAKLLRRVIGADVSLHLEPSPCPAMIQADVGMLEQVLMNLVVNARDAMPTGGQLAIRVLSAEIDEAHQRDHPEASLGRFVCLRVSDSGLGMSPEVMGRIFEPFFTTKSPGRGTGLGLATVRNIVRQHQGWLEVASRVGAGTVFNLYFPAISWAGAAVESPPLIPSVRGGTETILLAEDETVVREMAAMILRRQGYRVLEAGSGLMALSVWRQHADSVHLVLTDMVMPDGVSGWELVEQLRTLKPGLKIVYTSGYCTDAMAGRVKLEEGVNFLAKPYRPQNLVKIVRDQLDT